MLRSSLLRSAARRLEQQPRLRSSGGAAARLRPSALRRRPAAAICPAVQRCFCDGPATLGLPEPAASAASVSAAGATGSQALGRVGGVKTPGAKMSMTFTCDVCDTRSTKIFHRHSYEKGTIIVRCPGCENLHLVADNLGWFLDGPDGNNIEHILASVRLPPVSLVGASQSSSRGRACD